MMAAVIAGVPTTYRSLAALDGARHTAASTSIIAIRVWSINDGAAWSLTADQDLRPGVTGKIQ
jgi:hypothetical protein